MQDIFLHPGEFYFGDECARIRTILGSCVAVTLWHPQLRVGGMCHYMLPSPSQPSRQALNGRYAEDALEMFMHEINRRKTQVSDYHAKFFGGGNMFPMLMKSQETNVGQRNLDIGKKLLLDKGFKIYSSHAGGIGYRRIVFEINTGNVWVYHSVGNTQQDSGKFV